jgi:hypothetical protein
VTMSVTGTALGSTDSATAAPLPPQQLQAGHVPAPSISVCRYVCRSQAQTGAPSGWQHGAGVVLCVVVWSGAMYGCMERCLGGRQEPCQLGRVTELTQQQLSSAQQLAEVVIEGGNFMRSNKRPSRIKPSK